MTIAARLKTTGMTYFACLITVREALRRVPGAEKISVDYPYGIGRV